MLIVPPRTLDPQAMPAFVRAVGGVRLAIGATPLGPAPLRLAESGGYRVRFLRGVACEGVLINTGGGMAGGDRMEVDVAVGPGAAATLTTQAAEKVYRAEGVETAAAIRLDVGEGARLDWLPQEQILFSGARFARTLDVALAADATLTLVESVVFGRIAMGEVVGEGSFRDRWRVRRAGRLLFAEDVRLDENLDRLLARPALGGGARALATVLHVAPDAEARCEEARSALDGAASECGVSAWNGMVVARFAARDPQALRADLARFLARWRGAPLPRSWQT